MSQYTEAKTTFRNPHLLLEALREMGFAEVQDHIGNPQQLRAYYESEQWNQKAEIIIRKEALTRISNDIGFVKKEDGTYGIVIGDIDERVYDAAWMRKLTNVYAEKGLIAKAKKLGLRPVGKKQVMVKGKSKIRLQFVKA